MPPRRGARCGCQSSCGDTACAVTVSEFTADWMRRHFPGSSERIARVYNGLDLEPFAGMGGEGAEAGVPLILSVGRLIEKKGFATLIESCALLRDRGTRFRCAIVGEGPLEDELAKAIADRDLAGYVTLAGPKNFGEIRDLLAETSVFALACATEADGGMDNLPTVIMEAMAAGCPCVSTRLAGVPEMVTEGETGFLLEEGDAAGIADAIAKLLGDPDSARAMGDAGRTLCHELFDREKTIRDLARALVSHGRVLQDSALVRQVRELKPAFRQQAVSRLKGRIGLGQKIPDPGDRASRRPVAGRPAPPDRWACNLLRVS